MRGVTGFVVLALSVAACRQTVVIDQSAVDAGAGGTAATADGGVFGSADDFGRVAQGHGRAGSVGQHDGSFGGSSALAVARDALDQYASKYQKVVWFGYSDFPGAMNCSPSQTCCIGAFSPPTHALGLQHAMHVCDQDQSCANPTAPSVRRRRRFTTVR